MQKEILEKYADLILKIGVNIQPGQGLYIACPIEKSEVAEILAKRAYAFGASMVRVHWENQKFDRINYENADLNCLCEVPKWLVDSKNYLVENNYCYIAISAENPNAFNGIDEKTLSNVALARGKALKKYSDAIMSNAIRWCVVSVPTNEWANLVYKNSENSEKKLFDAICRTLRLNELNPISSWEEHILKLENRAKFLTQANFKYLHFESENGTNLKVGLATNHVWISAREKAKDGKYFVANMPTEEIFTAPHKLRVDGIVKSTTPLCYNGNLIENFTLEFKRGKVVSFSAEKGYETLKYLLDIDKGTRMLGEVALIGKSSPVAKEKTLFYNTLFDENSSCHLALGKAYPTTVLNGEALNKKQLNALGLNDSIEHVDFMIGCDDLKITGVSDTNKKTPLFESGDWVI